MMCSRFEMKTIYVLREGKKKRVRQARCDAMQENETKNRTEQKAGTRKKWAEVN